MTALLVLAAIAFGYWASPVLVPLALSILLAFLLNPIVTYLQRRKMPRTVAAFLVTSVGLLIVGVLAWIFTAQVVYLGEQLPVYERKVTERIDEIRESGESSLLAKVQGFVERVSRAATRSRSGDAENAPLPVTVVGEGGWSLTPILATLGAVLEPFAITGLVVVQLIYLLIDSENIRDRFLRLAGRTNMTVTTRALDDAASRISRFLLAQFILNTAFGVVVAVGLFLLGVPHALLWGFIAAVLRYVPYIGPWLTAILPLAMSLMTADGWMQPIGVLLVFIAFELISNTIVEPLIYGRSIGVSQSALIVAIAFWAWLWGSMGLVLAAPLTVCLAILGKYVPALKFFDILLGDTPPLSSDTKFYQRLLARDEDDAYQIADAERENTSLPSLFDRLLVPALVAARRDFEGGRLERDAVAEIWGLTADIGEELAATQPPPEEAPSEEPTMPQPTILACAARDAADETALSLMQDLLRLYHIDLEIARPGKLVSEISAQAVETQPMAALIVSLPPGGISRTRLLCKRLKQSLPHLKILIGRWGEAEEGDESAQTKRLDQQLLDAGVDFVGHTMEETTDYLQRILPTLRLSATPHSRGSWRPQPTVTGAR